MSRFNGVVFIKGIMESQSFVLYSRATELGSDGRPIVPGVAASLDHEIVKPDRHQVTSTKDGSAEAFIGASDKLLEGEEIIIF